MKKAPIVFAVSGIKNSGKTTLIGKLITALTQRGYRVGVIKHDGHEFQADHVGTDSYKHKMSGAENVIVYSKTKLMMIKAHDKPNLEEMIALEQDMDIVILEGMKYSAYPKLEIVRAAVSKESVCDPKTLLGIVTDTELVIPGVPKLGMDEEEKILEVVQAFIDKNGN